MRLMREEGYDSEEKGRRRNHEDDASGSVR